MIVKAILLACVLHLALSIHFDFDSLNAKLKWQNYKTQYGKKYRSLEHEMERFMIFKHNLKKVTQHNLEHKMGLHTYKMGINHFSDWTKDELKMLTLPNARNITSTHKNKLQILGKQKVTTPDSFDWRDHDVVTDVKNQEQCGSCWAFSATGAIESAWAIKEGFKVTLSEQQLVDCSRTYGNGGCKGGWMPTAFRYIVENGGIAVDSEYPYHARDEECKSIEGMQGVALSGYKEIADCDEDKLKETVASVGPISVCFDLRDSFYGYESGVYYEEECTTNACSHAVLAVGYGSENGQDYWIVKNSWGPGWGNNGYIKMARNRDNNCGIASHGSYPIIAD